MLLLEIALIYVVYRQYKKIKFLRALSSTSLNTAPPATRTSADSEKAPLGTPEKIPAASSEVEVQPAFEDWDWDTHSARKKNGRFREHYMVSDFLR